jgi:hypothetical protein
VEEQPEPGRPKYLGHTVTLEGVAGYRRLDGFNIKDPDNGSDFIVAVFANRNRHELVSVNSRDKVRFTGKVDRYNDSVQLLTLKECHLVR